MRELSLYTGCGGGLLGSHLLGWRALGYVEREPYRCRVLSQRIADGLLDDAPIYCGDVREFIRGGYADSYAGLVDVVSGGFPCQPFSVAGLQLAEADGRNCWPETIEVVRRIRPRFGWFENVPGLLRLAYWKTICRDLQEAGYEMRHCILGGYDVGAPHVRKRLWILAHTNQNGSQARTPNADTRQEGNATIPLNESENVAHAENHNGRSGECGAQTGTRQDEQWGRGLASGGEISNADEARCGELRRAGADESEYSATERGRVAWWRDDPAERGQTALPHVDRVVDGLAYRVDRLAAIGDGQIPAVVAAAWRKLMREMQQTRVMENTKMRQAHE